MPKITFDRSSSSSSSSPGSSPKFFGFAFAPRSPTPKANIIASNNKVRKELLLSIKYLNLQKEMKSGIVDEFEVPECKALAADLGQLFEQSLFTDCEVVTEDGTYFKVKKWREKQK